MQYSVYEKAMEMYKGVEWMRQIQVETSIQCQKIKKKIQRILFTITGVKKIVRYHKDFINKGLSH